MQASNSNWLYQLQPDQIMKAYADLGITELWFAIGVAQDNSKNQVRLASDPSDLQMFGPADPIAEKSTSRKKKARTNVFHLALNLSWLDEDLNPVPAPRAQFVFYPQYPEVRFTGFLKGCRSAPSWLFDYDQRAPGKIMIFGSKPLKAFNQGGPTREIFALTIPHDAQAAGWFRGRFASAEKIGKRLARIPIAPDSSTNTKIDLLKNLKKFRSEWRRAMRMTKDGIFETKTGANNAAGLHLEYLFGVVSNSLPEPDYLDWELKARKVDKPNATLGSSRHTVFTPDPDGGAYVDMDLVDFVKKWGYKNENKQYAGKRYDLTASGMRIGVGHKRLPDMELRLSGYTSEKEFDVDGALELVDHRDETVAASWSFSRMLAHWQKNTLEQLTSLWFTAHPSMGTTNFGWAISSNWARNQNLPTYYGHSQAENPIGIQVST